MRLLVNNAVPLVFIFLSMVAIPLSGFSASYLVQEMMTRLARIPSWFCLCSSDFGLGWDYFGMVLGAMAGQVGPLFSSPIGVWPDYREVLLACLVWYSHRHGIRLDVRRCSTRAKGERDGHVLYLGFFVNGIYQFVVLYIRDGLFPSVIHSYSFREAMEFVSH